MNFNIKDTVVSFYRESNKPTFWFAAIVLSKLLAFLPPFPPFVIYGIFILYSLYVLRRANFVFCIPLLLFLAYIPFQLLLVTPDSMFQSWERYVLFLLLLLCVSPLVIGDDFVVDYRKTIFQMSLAVCSFIGVGSFFARFLGINYGTQRQLDFILNTGVFGGLTSHSMLLGPVAGIGAIYGIWLGYTRRSYAWWGIAVLCACSVMFSTSRASLMAAIAGITILLYKLSDTGTTFTKVTVGLIMLGTVSFPIWGGALDGVIRKNEANIAAGGVSSSRDALWESRIKEFESSPVLGVGFDAIDVKIASGGFDKNTGMVESGSSWLIILSMTGLVGATILFPFLIGTYKNVLKNDGEHSALICGILTLFYVHMIAEGYIFYGGSMLAFLLWITLGVAYDYNNASEE